MARRLKILELTEEEKMTLVEWTKNPDTNKRLKKRAQIILFSYENRPVKEIQEELSLSRESISTWKKRFLQSRLEGLLDLRLRKRRKRQKKKNEK